MNPFESIASKVGFKNELVKQEYGLKCDKCGRIYDYYEFDTGYVVKDGCDCEMIKLAKKKEKRLNNGINHKKPTIYSRNQL